MTSERSITLSKARTTLQASNWYTPSEAALQYRPMGVVRAVGKFTQPPFQHFTSQSGAEIECTGDALCPLCAAGLPAQARKAVSICLHVWNRWRLAWVDGEVQEVRASVITLCTDHNILAEVTQLPAP